VLPEAPPAEAGLTPTLQVANGPIAAGAGPRPLAVRLEEPDRLADDFTRPPRSGLLFDLDTGEVLWRRDPERILPIASLTKMMTALLVVRAEPPRAKVRIGKVALSYAGSGVGLLPRGKDVSVETLLYGLLLPSGNDAARALAVHVGGSLGGFVERMNQRAAELGLRCTAFSGADGYEDAGNHSCAVDLAALARAVLDQPRLARIVASRSAIRPMPIKGGRVFLFNHNPLLREGYPGTLGIKTGYTDEAGRCLVAAARRHGRRLGVILLHSPDPGRQARRLLNRGFQVADA
jgi:D-alanyl-D-alanine carboxypeptidase (penicillin-binding protein 5/6)